MRLEVSKDRWSKVSKSVSYFLVFTKKIVSKIVGLENHSGTKSIKALWRLVSETDVLISLLILEGVLFQRWVP